MRFFINTITNIKNLKKDLQNINISDNLESKQQLVNKVHL